LQPNEEAHFQLRWLGSTYGWVEGAAENAQPVQMRLPSVISPDLTTSYTTNINGFYMRSQRLDSAPHVAPFAGGFSSVDSYSQMQTNLWQITKDVSSTIRSKVQAGWVMYVGGVGPELNAEFPFQLSTASFCSPAFDVGLGTISPSGKAQMFMRAGVTIEETPVHEFGHILDYTWFYANPTDYPLGYYVDGGGEHRQTITSTTYLSGAYATSIADTTNVPRGQYGLNSVFEFWAELFRCRKATGAVGQYNSTTLLSLLGTALRVINFGNFCTTIGL
jgi:hypothetical protein